MSKRWRGVKRDASGKGDEAGASLLTSDRVVILDEILYMSNT
jgi:hypothetical protein